MWVPFARAAKDFAVLGADAPFRMFAGSLVIPADRDVNFGVDALLAADLEHAPDQVGFQVGMR